MPIGPRNIIIHELIGREVIVLHHSDPTLIGRRGIIVDETLQTLVIKEKEEIVVPKKNGVFCVKINGEWTVVKGEEILFRPWERTKRGYKKYLRRRVTTFKEGECIRRYLQNV